MKERIDISILKSAIGINDSYIVVNRSEQVDCVPFSLSPKENQIRYFMKTFSAMSNGKGGIIIVGKEIRPETDYFLMRDKDEDGPQMIFLYPYTKEECYEFDIDSRDLNFLSMEFLFYLEGAELDYEIVRSHINGLFYLLFVVQPAKGRYVYCERFAYRRKDFYTEQDISTVLSEGFRTETYPYLQREDEILRPFTLHHRGYFKNTPLDSVLDFESGSGSVFKYLSLGAFLICLENGSLRFVEPSYWKDRYEDRFYTALYSSSLGYKPGRLYATCVTRNRQSEAAWKVYSSGSSGLSSRCVQLELNTRLLRRVLTKSIKGYTVYEGEVNYFYEDRIINTLHEMDNPFHRYYFDDFNLHSFLRLMLIKRQAYAHEGEIRFFLVPKQEEKRNNHDDAKVLDVIIPWRKLIKRAYVDSNTSKAELIALKNSALKANIVFVNDRIDYTEREYSMKNKVHIPLTIMDIDKMEDNESGLYIGVDDSDFPA